MPADLIHTLFRTVILTVTAFGGICQAATLPDHRPLSILIIADEVNPHRLADTDLTQPQDLAPA